MTDTTEVARVERTLMYDFRVDAICWRRKAIEEYIKAHELPPMFIDQATDTLLQEFETKYKEYLFRYAVTEYHATEATKASNVGTERLDETPPMYLAFGYGRESGNLLAHPMFSDEHLDEYLLAQNRWERMAFNDGRGPEFVMVGYIAYTLTVKDHLTEKDL